MWFGEHTAEPPFNGNRIVDKRVLIFSALFIGACVGGDGANGSVSLVALDAEAAGDNCEAGGQRIQAGIDANGDGTLDADEVTSTRYVCNGVGATGAVGADGAAGTDGAAGADGAAGLTSLVTTTEEPAGANCANGGTLVSHGLDDDANGVLEAAEVDGSSYVCNGAAGNDGTNGQTTLVSSAPEAPGAVCAAGGTIVSYGVDDNADGTLDPNEVDGFYPICDGQDGADGADGADGINTIMTTIFVATGGGCPEGGTRVDYGGDDNADGTLQPSEVDGTTYICNGETGATGATGADGADGGPHTIVNLDYQGAAQFYTCFEGIPVEIQAGVDDNENGVLELTEVDVTTVVCQLGQAPL